MKEPKKLPRPAKAEDDLSEGHLKWLVENRSASQKLSLKLFLLLKKYKTALLRHFLAVASCISER
jgi:hypothetical protein